LSTFAATVHPFGGLVALSGLLWIVKHARSGALVGLGLGTPTSALAVATGIAAGVGLGGHLLLSASLTLGYRPHVSDVTSLAGALAYDVGVQVLATESFFRGAVFNRLQRRWSFAVAATLSSGACVIRYVVDPLLPGTAELMTGALFYVTILSVVNAALFWRFGTLVPGLVCAATFFAAYRLLGA
jgi:hypothetical protein